MVESKVIGSFFFNCAGVGTPNLPVVQGSSVVTWLPSFWVGNLWPMGTFQGQLTIWVKIQTMTLIHSNHGAEFQKVLSKVFASTRIMSHFRSSQSVHWQPRLTTQRCTAPLLWHRSYTVMVSLLSGTDSCKDYLQPWILQAPT